MTEQASDGASTSGDRAAGKAGEGVVVAFGQTMKTLRVRAGLDRTEFGKRLGYWTATDGRVVRAGAEDSVTADDRPGGGAEGGDCAEVVAGTAAVHVRDSKVVAGPVHTVSREAWAGFVGLAVSESGV